jgi:hypothetical protein
MTLSKSYPKVVVVVLFGAVAVSANLKCSYAKCMQELKRDVPVDQWYQEGKGDEARYYHADPCSPSARQIGYKLKEKGEFERKYPADFNPSKIRCQHCADNITSGHVWKQVQGISEWKDSSFYHYDNTERHSGCKTAYSKVSTERRLVYPLSDSRNEQCRTCRAQLKDGCYTDYKRGVKNKGTIHQEPKRGDVALEVKGAYMRGLRSLRPAGEFRYYGILCRREYEDTYGRKERTFAAGKHPEFWKCDGCRKTISKDQTFNEMIDREDDYPLNTTVKILALVGKSHPHQNKEGTCVSKREDGRFEVKYFDTSLFVLPKHLFRVRRYHNRNCSKAPMKALRPFLQKQSKQFNAGDHERHLAFQGTPDTRLTRSSRRERRRLNGIAERMRKHLLQ